MLSTVLVACITVTGSVIIIVVKHTIETHYLSLEKMGSNDSLANSMDVAGSLILGLRIDHRFFL